MSQRDLEPLWLRYILMITTRDERKALDKFAAIHNVYNVFSNRLLHHYSRFSTYCMSGHLTLWKWTIEAALKSLLTSIWPYRYLSACLWIDINISVQPVCVKYNIKITVSSSIASHAVTFTELWYFTYPKLVEVPWKLPLSSQKFKQTLDVQLGVPSGLWLSLNSRPQIAVT